MKRAAGTRPGVGLWGLPPQSADGNPADNERPGAVGALYLAAFRLVGTSDGIEIPDLSLCNSHESGCGPLDAFIDWQKTVALFVRVLRAGCIVVPE